MKSIRLPHYIPYLLLLSAPLTLSSAETSSNAAPVISTPALTPKALDKGMVMKLSVAFTTASKWTFSQGGGTNVDYFSTSQLGEEKLIWKSSSSYEDADDDVFSCEYRKIDNFTAQFTFKQTKAGGGDTLKNEYGTGKFILLFTSFDKSTNTYHGTVVMSDTYKGYGMYDRENVAGNYVDNSSGAGIFSLKIP